MSGRDTSPGRADIERLGEFDKPGAQGVGTPQEDGDLDADAGGLPLLCK